MTTVFGIVSPQDLMDHVYQNVAKSEVGHNLSLNLQTTVKSKDMPQVRVAREKFAEVFQGSQENYILYMITCSQKRK